MPAPKRSAATAAAPPTKKRKLDKNVQKFYAVRHGHHPGVYMTWPECERETTGYKNATYKSFLTQAEAEAFVRGQNPGGPSDQTEKYYAVAVGSRPGVYTSWPEAQKAYSGVKGPKYRKFLSRPEAEQYVRAFAAVNTAAAAVEEEEGGEDEEDSYESEFDFDLDVVGKIDSCLTGAEDEKKRDGLTVVNTDGSSRGNGKAKALAGIGVYFGDGDHRNVAERLDLDPQTNQRAELAAIRRALEIVGPHEGLLIRTDSQYSINCLCDWYRKWQTSGWTTSTGKPVMNRDLVEPIRRLIDERDKAGTKTEFEWVKGHKGDPGNTAADRLAVQGSQKPRP